MHMQLCGIFIIMCKTFKGDIISKYTLKCIKPALIEYLCSCYVHVKILVPILENVQKRQTL